MIELRTDTFVGMRFAGALSLLQSERKGFIRRAAWGPDVRVCLQVPDGHSKMTAEYLYVKSRYGMAPWTPNMIELVTDEDWEYHDSD